MWYLYFNIILISRNLRIFSKPHWLFQKNSRRTLTLNIFHWVIFLAFFVIFLNFNIQKNSKSMLFLPHPTFSFFFFLYKQFRGHFVCLNILKRFFLTFVLYFNNSGLIFALFQNIESLNFYSYDTEIKALIQF